MQACAVPSFALRAASACVDQTSVKETYTRGKRDLLCGLLRACFPAAFLGGVPAASVSGSAPLDLPMTENMFSN
jgi:hypothetical protein